MLNLDLAKAQELIALSIADRGEDYEYEYPTKCRNVHNVSSTYNYEDGTYDYDLSEATPGCIVGDALFKGGIPLFELGAQGRNDNAASTLLEYLEGEELVKYTDSAASFLSNVQDSQDVGIPWGAAAEAAARGKYLRYKYDQVGQRIPGEFEEYEGLDV